MINIFKYELLCYDQDEQYYYLEKGIGFGESLSHAAKTIESNHDDIVAIKHLEIFDLELCSLPSKLYNEVGECLKSFDIYEERCDENGVLINE